MPTPAKLARCAVCDREIIGFDDIDRCITIWFHRWAARPYHTAIAPLSQVVTVPDLPDVPPMPESELRLMDGNR